MDRISPYSSHLRQVPYKGHPRPQPPIWVRAAHVLLKIGHAMDVASLDYLEGVRF
jgi:hypothetical protein